VRAAALARLRPELARELAEPSFRRLELGQALLVEAGNRERGRQRLELGPDEERLSQLFARQRADADASVRDELDEPERGQAAQRLADRSPRDPELVRERLLTEDRARLDLPRDDLLLEGVGDLVGFGRLHSGARG
jgi:hypothetical protein